MQTVYPQPSLSSFEHLLVHYMNGQIAEHSWDQMMETFDHEGVPVFERMAFARFMSDVIADADAKDLNVPKPDELEELLVQIRS